jgi:hypothetical protein
MSEVKLGNPHLEAVGLSEACVTLLANLDEDYCIIESDNYTGVTKIIGLIEWLRDVKIAGGGEPEVGIAKLNNITLSVVALLIPYISNGLKHFNV